MHDIARIKSVKDELNRNRELAQSFLIRFIQPSMKQGVVSVMRKLDEIESLFLAREAEDGRNAESEAIALDAAETAMRLHVIPSLEQWKKAPNDTMLF